MRPTAFRICDFKSIIDSGVCILSGDGITVLAGQNEAGKTAVLTALRDFDLEAGNKPRTQDYEPDDRFDIKPSVSVQFQVDVEEITAGLRDDKCSIPEGVLPWLGGRGTIWITRELPSGKYSLEPEANKFWESAERTTGLAEPPDSDEEVAEAPTEGNQPESAESDSRPLGAEEFAAFLRDYWPSFVYFDTFHDSLPRQVEFDDLQGVKNPKSSPPARAPGTASTPSSSADAVKSKVPGSVHDFVVMANLDLTRIEALADNDKTLGNYLSSRSAAITGDFLTYWKQKVEQDETVDLRVRHIRDSEGTLKLAFYVHDKSDQFPDQRSKGFLWFLSFYLRLAAAQRRYPNRKQLLLIDEPGSYLHARAQRDVLHLFEDRIASKDNIIYSTHSPYLIPPSHLNRVRIVLKTTQGTKILDRLTHPDLRGQDFADSLSPVISAIGMDISQALRFNKPKNLFVEGISDLLYLSAWATLLRPQFLEQFNIFPGTGATTIPLLGSLFTGWGQRFVVLLDNDDQGKATAERLSKDLLMPRSRVVHPKDAKTTEDLLSHDDFVALLGELDQSLALQPAESPSSAIKRQAIDKVLLARKLSDVLSSKKLELTKKSQDAINRALREIEAAWDA